MDFSNGGYEAYKANIEKRVKLLETRYKIKKAQYSDYLNGEAAKQEPKYKDVLKQKELAFKSAQHAAEKEKLICQFLRPDNQDDMTYRLRQKKEFSDKVQQAIPEDMDLLFHGTPIYYAQKIIESKGISSSADRLGFETSYDAEGQVSVTTKDSLSTTIDTYTDLTAENGYLPAGCVFVMRARNKDEGAKMITDNIDFTEPDRLYAVLTTPENKERVQSWLSDAGMDTKLVHDFDGFIKSVQQEKNKDRIQEAHSQTSFFQKGHYETR